MSTPKLTERRQAILRAAIVHGTYRPWSRTGFTDCLALVASGHLEEADDVPGAYRATEAGEAAAELLELVS